MFGTFGLFQNYIIEFRNQSDLTAVRCLDIKYATVHYKKEFNLQGFSCGFILTKKSQPFLFLLQETEIKVDWKAKMTKYVVQRGVRGKFTFLKLLGNGSFAKVHLVNKNISGGQLKDHFKLFAIKSVFKSNLQDSAANVQQLMDEIDIHNELYQCENILRLYQVYESKRYVHLVMDYQTGGTLL